jgi:RHS repeat-associated protein
MTTAAICATREVSWIPSLYRGEQFDADLGLYYLRARYYNPATGRFLSRDPEDGKIKIPATLHKYLYAGGDPMNRIDPTGKAELGDYVSMLDLDSMAGRLEMDATGAVIRRFLECVADVIAAYAMGSSEALDWCITAMGSTV